MWMMPGLVALLAALWGGLNRLGWDLPMPRPDFATAHGPLMVSGFLGLVISLERAVGLNDPRALLVPALAGVGGLMVVLGLGLGAGPLGSVFFVLASLGLVALYALIARVRAELFIGVMAGGALAWTIGNILWLMGWPIYRLVPWWILFLVLTIAGERLELTRFLKPSPGSRQAFVLILLLLLIGAVVGGIWPTSGIRVVGAGLLALGLWLMRFDIARRTVRQTGVTRFVAVCLLTGYVWLCVSGGMALATSDWLPGPLYDAVLHSVFLGFVFAMIFGHAPIILPALLHIPLQFSRFFYVPLIVLQASLLVRVLGDLIPWWPARLWGGLGSEVAILLFVVTVVRAVRGAKAASLAGAREPVQGRRPAQDSGPA